MHTQRSTAEWIISRGAHYLLTVKDNQPGLKRALEKLPWKDVPAVSSVDTGHGRRVRRTVQAVEAPEWIDFPGAAQVIRIRRTTTTAKRRSTGGNGRVIRPSMSCPFPAGGRFCLLMKFIALTKRSRMRFYPMSRTERLF